MTIKPAYGRDYKNMKAVKADWEAGKDFEICDMFSGRCGSYVNKDDAPKGESIEVRYNQMRGVMIIKT